MWPFKTQRDEVAKRGSRQELMDNQLIVSPQSEHGLGSESQESTQTLVLDIVFKLGHMPQSQRFYTH